jgi:hypothetical protein
MDAFGLGNDWTDIHIKELVGCLAWNDLTVNAQGVEHPSTILTIFLMTAIVTNFESIPCLLTLQGLGIRTKLGHCCEE